MLENNLLKQSSNEVFVDEAFTSDAKQLEYSSRQVVIDKCGLSTC